LSFTVNPYYDQSRADSDFQSLTGAKGVNGTANLFAGSHFPGSVSYNYADNSTGTFGLTGQPNFTTVGKTQGFSVNWSALLPNMPTLSVGYSQGSGNSTLFGTDQRDNSSTRLFNVHSNYTIAGFRLNGFFTRNSVKSEFPQFLSNDGYADSRHDERLELQRQQRECERELSSHDKVHLERQSELHQQPDRLPGTEPEQQRDSGAGTGFGVGLSFLDFRWWSYL